MELLTAVCMIIVTTVLVSASVHDVRTREVPDVHWVIIGTTAIAAMTAAMLSDNVTAERIMVCIGSAMILIDILYDRERPSYLTVLFYVTAASMFVIPLMTSFDDTFVKNSITIPVCFIIFIALFFGGVIKGGADVKCLIVLAILFPVYPEALGSPITDIPSVPVLIPFALAVLFCASLFSVISFVPVILRNVLRGDTKMPNMFIGHRTDAQRADGPHVWPMRGCETEEDGKVWVVPQIPFIVPITAAVLFLLFTGSG